jgi:ABC-2 type transport system permease protein
MQKYRASFLMGLQRSLEYRFEFLVGIFSTLFPVLIQVFLWSAIYGGTGQNTMYGYDFSQMLAYVAIAGAVGKFVVSGVEEMVNSDIHTGGLSAFIVKPVKYIPFRFFQAMGQKFASTVTMLIFSAVCCAVLVFSVDFEIRLYSVCLFVPALILAMLVNFFIFFILSISAFWLTEVGRFFHALQIAVMVASGGVFPITVFGSTYAAISRFLPFCYTSYFPISVMTGALEIKEVLAGICVQIVWIAALAALSNVFWRAGLKRYVAVGG